MSEQNQNQKLIEAIQKKAAGGALSCAAVFVIAKEQRVAPEEAGRTLDLIEISIEKCLLGLFGYGPQKKIVRPAESVSAELEKAISANLTDGRLPCVKAWNIADTLHLSKMDVAAACEKLGMKISRCQLGAF